MSEREKFGEFFRQFYEKELLAAARSGEKFIMVDFSQLDIFDPNLADKLLNDPNTILEEARDAIMSVDLPESNLKIEPRFINLPDQQTVRIRELRSEHMGKLVCVEGTVRRTSEVKPEIAVGVFECGDCGNKMHVEQTDKFIKNPVYCDADECGRKSNFKLVDKKLFDSRWVVLEETFESASGEKPGEVKIYLKEDLTTPVMQRRTDPGNTLKVVGIVTEAHNMVKGKMKTQLDIFVRANSVVFTEVEWEEVNISEEDENRIKEFSVDPNVYEKLTKSLAPSIFGLDEIKSSIVLQLFGGVQQHLPDGTKIRGDIHILLLGDPSTAKSQLLKLASKIIPRGKYVSGGGVTGAGLTASVYKDEELGGWVLEAGAMVLSNKGIMCIDEFDKIHKDDQSRLHEALEQQTVSIAKAGIVATLPAQVSVLAGANPKFSRFDRYKAISEQILIPDTLLSRFDLKFALRDIPEKDKDSRLSEYIMATRLDPQTATPEIEPSFFRKYIAYVRKNCKPRMTREATEKIREFYIDMRSKYQENTQAVPITLRQNEALLRLSEASAKIRLSETVSADDANRAIECMMFSLKELGYDIESGTFDIDRTEGVPASQRNKLQRILDIIQTLEKSMGTRLIPKEEIGVMGVDQGLTESDVDDFLGRLKREGVIFEPKPGIVQRL